MSRRASPFTGPALLLALAIPASLPAAQETCADADGNASLALIVQLRSDRQPAQKPGPSWSGAKAIKKFSIEEPAWRQEAGALLVRIKRKNLEAAQKLIAAQRDVEIVEADLLPAELAVKERDLAVTPSPDQWHLTTIRAEKAWENGSSSALDGTQLIAAIIDSGVDLTTPALQQRQWREPKPGGDVGGRAFIAVPESMQNGDLGNGHATHIAGLIAGEAGAMKPLAPNSSFMSLTVGHRHGRNCVSGAAVIEAIAYARRHGVVAANISWSMGPSKSVRKAMRDAQDILFVVAPETEGSLEATPSFPSWYTLPNIITVVQSNRGDVWSAPNVTGSRVDIAAPGDRLPSVIGSEAGITEVSGSSYAAPLVTGAALMVKALAPGWNAVQLKRYLIDSADYLICDPVTAACDSRCWNGLGYGRLDTARATEAPVSVEWPNAWDRPVTPEGIIVKWRTLFTSEACPTLDAEILSDGASSGRVLTGIPVTANRAILRAPADMGKRARIRLTCSGTQLQALSEEFEPHNVAVDNEGVWASSAKPRRIAKESAPQRSIRSGCTGQMNP